MGDFRSTTKKALEQLGYQNGSSQENFVETYGDLFSRETSVEYYDAQGNKNRVAVESEYDKLRHLKSALDTLGRNAAADGQAANRQAEVSIGGEDSFFDDEPLDLADFADDAELSMNMDDTIGCATELLESVNKKLESGKISDENYLRLCSVRANLATCVVSLSNIRVKEQLDRINGRYEAVMEEQPLLVAQFDGIEKRAEEIQQDRMEADLEDDRASIYQAGMENVGSGQSMGENFVTDTRDFFRTYVMEDPRELIAELDGEIAAYENLRLDNAKLYFPNVETAGLVELEEKIEEFRVTTPGEAAVEKAQCKSRAVERVKKQLLDHLEIGPEAMKLTREFQRQVESNTPYEKMEEFFDQYVQNSQALQDVDPGRVSRAKRSFVSECIKMHMDMEKVDKTAQQEAKALEEMREQATLTSLKLKRAFLIHRQPQLYDKFMEDKLAQAAASSEDTLRQQLGKMSRDLSKYHKGLLNSTEYSDFKKALEKAATTGDLEELSRKVEGYVTTKETAGSGIKTESGRGRLAIAKNVRQLVSGYLRTKAEMHEQVEPVSKLNKRSAEVQPTVNPLEKIMQRGHDAQDKLKAFYKKKAFQPNELEDVKEAMLDNLMRKYVTIMGRVDEGKRMLEQCKADPKFASETLMATRNMMSQRFFSNEALITPDNMKTLDKTNLITAISKGSIIFNSQTKKTTAKNKTISMQPPQKKPMTMKHD